MRILVAEDERDMNRLIVRELTKNGYSVDACYDGEDALSYILSTEYDACVLDISMPKMSGLEVVSALRRRKNNTPVLFLTARDSVSDRVEGLDRGADDYLVKPFSFEELLARVRVLLRKKADAKSNIYTVADLTVDTKTRSVTRGGNAILLSGKEYALLEYLVVNSGIMLSRERIESHIWNYDYAGGTNVVDVYIRYLRKKIDDPYEQKLIHTVRGSGYILKS